MAQRAERDPVLSDDGRWWVVGDRLLRVIAGGADDVDDDADSDGDPEDDPDDDSDGGAGGDKGGADDKLGDPRIKQLSDEAAEHRRRKRAAEIERDKLAARLKEIEDKDKSELDRAVARVTELEGDLAAAQDTIQRMGLDNAFLKDNTHAWHDPEDVLIRLRGAEGVTVNTEGEVEGLKDFLDTLATTKSHLVKAKEDSKDKDDQKPSGSDFNGRKDKDGGKKDEAAKRRELQQRFPALRR